MRPLAIIAVIAVVWLCGAGTAFARGRKVVHARVDLATGTVTLVDAPSLAAATPATPRAARSLVASYDAGIVLVRTVGGKDVLKLAVGKHEHEWMPWWTIQPGLFVFVWRERVLSPGRPDTSRDVLRAIDLVTGAELWRRETEGTVPVGIRRLLVAAGGTFDLVDSRTGKLHRRLALAGSEPSAFAIAGGDTLIDTGHALARVTADGTIAWRADNLGPVASITPLAEPAARYLPDPRDPAAPLPATGAWLLVTESRLAVLDPVSGKMRWSAPSTSTSVLLDGAQLFAADIARGPTRSSGATVKLIVRDLAAGKVTRELAIFHDPYFFDTATAVIAAKRGNLVEVTSEFIVLD